MKIHTYLLIITILSSGCTTVVTQCDCHLKNAEPINAVSIDYKLRSSFDQPTGRSNRKLDYIGTATCLRINKSGVDCKPQADLELLKTEDLITFETDAVPEYELEIWSLYKQKSTYYIIQHEGVFMKSFLSQKKTFHEFFMSYDRKVALKSRNEDNAAIEMSDLMNGRMQNIMYVSKDDRNAVMRLQMEAYTLKCEPVN